VAENSVNLPSGFILENSLPEGFELESREGLLPRFIKGVWNAGPAAMLNAIRTKSEVGKTFRDAEALTQLQTARKQGEGELSLEEAYKRADAVIAQRNKKPLLLGGTAGQILAGNVVPMAPAQTIPEKTVDVAAGVGGALTNIALTRRIIPGLPEPLTWEVATEAAGGTPGTGAAMVGIMGAAGKVAGKAVPGTTIGKRVLRRTVKAGLEGGGFAGMAAVQGASPEEIATQFLIPTVFGALSSLKELPVTVRRAEMKKLVQRVAELDKRVPPEAVTAAEKQIDAGTYDTWTPPEQTTSIGAEAGPTFKPRGRVMGELGRETTSQKPSLIEKIVGKPVTQMTKEEYEYGRWHDEKGRKLDSEGLNSYISYEEELQRQAPPVVSQKPPSGATQPTLPIAGEVQTGKSFTMRGYHATTAQFKQFEIPAKTRTKESDLTARGVFFYGDRTDAERLHLPEGKKRIIETDISWQNPFVFTKFKELYDYTGVDYKSPNKANEITAALKAKGHDGYVKRYQTKPGIDEAVVFDIEQTTPPAQPPAVADTSTKLTLYHGTNEVIPEGQLETRAPAYAGGLGTGIYFGQNLETAKFYGKNIYKVKATFGNPLRIGPGEDSYRIAPEIEQQYNETGEYDSILAGESVIPFDVKIGKKWVEVRDAHDLEQLGDLAKEAGHDAIIVHDLREGRSIQDEEVLILDRETIQSPTIPPAEPPAPPAAIPGEEGRAYQQGPSMRRAYIAHEAEQRGIRPPYEGSSPETKAMWRQQAIDEGIPAVVDEMAVDLIGNPRPLTDVEIAGFDVRRQQLADSYDAARVALDKAAPESPEAKQAAKALRTYDELYVSLGKAGGLTGTQWGRAGVSMQGERTIANDPTNTLAMLTKAAVSKGDKLTEPERADVEAKVRQVKKATAQADVVRRTEGRKQAQRITRLGKRRYRGMTEAEKDAEVQETLKDMTDDNQDLSIRRLVENFASRPDAGDFDKVVGRVKALLPDVTIESAADSIVNATQRKTRMTDVLVAVINEIASRQPRRNNKLRTDIDDFNYYIERGEAREPNRRVPKTETEANQKLIEIRDQVRAQYEASDARQKQKLEKTLAFLNARLANGDYGPRTKAEKPLRSEELERLDYQVYRARQELNQRIANLDPWWAHPARAFTQPFREIQEWKSSLDMSALLRQAGVAVRTHPIRTLRRLPGAIEAMFNEEQAWKINNKIENGERSWYYHRAGLEFTDYGGALNAREEAFAGNLIERLPGIGRLVRGSNRGFVTLLNTIRADSFDAMTRGFNRAGGLSLAESQAIANYVNVMTGRGSLKGLEKYAHTLNGLLWSPRFTLSRIQFRLGMPIGQAPTWRVRRVIAQEYARYVAGWVATTWLYEHIFGGTVEKDRRSSDYGKIVVGNTRLDPMSGLSQITVLLEREIRGETKTKAGEVQALYGPRHGFGQANPATVALRFGWGKLGFFPGTLVNLAMHEDVTGQPVTLKGELLKAPIPLGFEDLLPLIRDQGVPKAAALEVLNLLGEGVQVYEPKTTSRGPMRRRGPRRRSLRRRQE